MDFIWFQKNKKIKNSIVTLPIPDNKSDDSNLSSEESDCNFEIRWEASDTSTINETDGEISDDSFMSRGKSDESRC